MTMLGQVLTIIITLLTCGIVMYIAHKLSKKCYTKDMDSWQRLNLSAKIGLAAGIILIIVITAIARIT